MKTQVYCYYSQSCTQKKNQDKTKKMRELKKFEEKLLRLKFCKINRKKNYFQTLEIVNSNYEECKPRFHFQNCSL